MDETSAEKFASALSRTMKALCEMWINFSTNIEVTGYIHVLVDRKAKFNYIVDEEFHNKHNDSAAVLQLLSNTYYSRPAADFVTKPTNSADAVHSEQECSAALQDSKVIGNSVPVPDVPTVTSHDVHDDIKNSTLPAMKRKGEKTYFEVLAGTQLSSKAKRYQDGCKTSVTISEKPPADKYDLGKYKASADSQQPELVIEIKREREDPEDNPMDSHNANYEQPHFEQDLSSNMAAHDFTGMATEISNGADSAAMDMGQLQVQTLTQSVTSVQHEPHTQSCSFPVLLHTINQTDIPVSSFPVAALPTDTTALPSISTGGGIAEDQVKLKTTFKRHPKKKSAIREKPKVTDSWKQSRRKIAVRKSCPPEFLTTHISEPNKKQTNKAVPKANPMFCKGKSTQYSVEDMNKAIELVHEGMTVIDSAFLFGIPRATLFNRSRDGCKTHSGRCSEVFSRTHCGKKSSQSRKRQKMMQYTPEMVDKAIEVVHKGMPVIDAAILHNIPRASLFIRSSKGCTTHSGRCSTVSSKGKVHRSKTARFKYLKLIQSKDQQECSVGEALPEAGTSVSESTADNFTQSALHSSVFPTEIVPKLLAVASLDVGTSEVPVTVHAEKGKPTQVPVQKMDEDQRCERGPVFDALTNAVRVKLERSSIDEYYK